MRLILIAGWLVVLGGSTVRAQAVCPTEALKDPNMTLADMYAKAEAKAKAWKPDVVIAEATTTAVGMLQESGKSATWNLTFVSPSAKQQVLINVLNGAFNCSAMKAKGVTVPNLKAGLFKDSAKLYAIAKEHGAEYISKGYAVQAALHVGDGGHTTWDLSYMLKDDDAGVLVRVDAATGAFEEVVD